MDRKEFFDKALKLGFCSCTLLPMLTESTPAETSLINADDTILQKEKLFIQNWLSDLLETIDEVLDEPTKIKLMEGCGRGCFNRHQFKKDIAIKGKGSLDKLIEAYKENFEIWQESNKVHIRYGEVSQGCYCPAAKYRPPKENDLHCECTRSTHQTVFQTALARPFKVDIVESVRRGGKTCHFLVHLDD